MTTRDLMVAEIQSILKRTSGSGESTVVAEAITHAIGHLQTEGFFFQQVRSLSFDTIVGQAWYDEDDDPDIPKFASFKSLRMTVGTTGRDIERQTDIATFELLVANATANSKPFSFIYRNEEIGLYPKPDAIYTMTVVGGSFPDAPATGGEADNVWMTKGYQVVMYSALEWLARVRIRDYEYANEMLAMANDMKNRLSIKRNRRQGAGRIRPTSW